jgi:predicted  nucleic acid-binding Zn-ribbon protein
MDEGEAFTLLVKLMNKYGLRDMFVQDMPGLHLHLFQFERLLEDLEPALYCHLRRRGVSPQLYATQWFLTLFAYRFPLQLVLRIYDLIFEEGLESTILRFGIAIMRRNAETLLGMKDMSGLSHFLKEKLFDVYIDQQPSASSILESGFFGSSGGSEKEIYRADLMVQDACDIPLAAEIIRSYTAEWEEKVRTEREREQELEGLKYTVSSQATQIRSLEERTEKSDQEHVQLASELVRMKVENEELSDANEGLQVQVRELKLVVDKQPAEVEEKLRTEMERIMKRNMEVQNENRNMEEQMADMEKDLVETKMKWAEVRQTVCFWSSSSFTDKCSQNSYRKTTMASDKNGQISGGLWMVSQPDLLMLRRFVCFFSVYLSLVGHHTSLFSSLEVDGSGRRLLHVYMYIDM